MREPQHAFPLAEDDDLPVRFVQKVLEHARELLELRRVERAGFARAVPHPGRVPVPGVLGVRVAQDPHRRHRAEQGAYVLRAQGLRPGQDGGGRGRVLPVGPELSRAHPGPKRVVRALGQLMAEARQQR